MAPPPKRFVKKNGVNVLNPEYLVWKKNGGKKAPPGPQIAPIVKLIVLVEVLQASDLAAKDRNMFGKRISSDPYVSVSLSCTPPTGAAVGKQKKVKDNKIKLGKTGTEKKNLSPVWNHSIKTGIPFSRMSETLCLVFELFDDDKVSSDDPLGTVTLPPFEWKDSRGAATWYDIPKDSCKHASGKIQVRVSSQVQRLQGVKSYC